MRPEEMYKGQVVRVRSWEDMATEYKLEGGEIYIADNLPYFIEEMKPLCGKTTIITDITPPSQDSYPWWSIECDINISGWALCPEFFEPFLVEDTVELEQGFILDELFA